MANENKLIQKEILESTISDMPKNILYCVLSKVPAFFWSRPGAGKSKSFVQAAKKLGYHLIDLRLSQIEAVDLRGIPTKNYMDFKIDHLNNIINETESLEKYKQPIVVWAMPDFLVEARQAREKGLNTIFLFDELNHADDSVQAAAYQFILEKKIGCFSLHDDDRVFAAGNYEGEGSFANAMSVGLANRFTHYYVNPDVVSWCAWARKNNIAPVIISFAESNPDIFDTYPEDDGAGKDKGWCTPRTLENSSNLYKTIVENQDEVLRLLNSYSSNYDETDNEFTKIIEKTIENKAKKSIMADLKINMAGSIGLSMSIRLINYIEIGHQVPNPNSILSGEVLDFGENTNRIDIQCISSNQCINKIHQEYKALKELHLLHNIKRISANTGILEIDEAIKLFYNRYENFVIFSKNNLNPDLFVFNVVTKLIRDLDIIPRKNYISDEVIQDISNSFKKITIN